ncbi:MAG: serine/threonine-protein phosphatase, partial [Candidatus Omnitrophica bacterium]|nr:serine/threonine-protein phosphatase [Candidatus Omnitrophota bacterium]
TDLVDIAVSYKPVFYMGGDYAKFHFIGEKKLIFVLADVTGHGVSAALIVNRIHIAIERLIREEIQPGELLKQLEEVISRDFGQMGIFLTAFCGLIDFSEKRLIYSNHGHPPQILLQSSDNSIVLMKSQTFLMGVGLEEDSVYHNDISFEEGDRIILFTDGITEARNEKGEMFGQERLEKFSRHNAGLDVVQFNNKMLEEIECFQKGQQEDDIFLLTIQNK